MTNAVATQARAQNALEQHKARGGEKTLAFCCSQRHADFMTEYFNNQGYRTVAIHSGNTSAPRAASLEQLESGDLDMVFSVDMLNEGLDIPNIDTVMMLRPTESTILWLQQFGRGLRKQIGKLGEEKILKVIDYIGNHRIFLTKPRSLFGLNEGDLEIDMALKRLEEKNEGLPDGCEVTYDLKSIEIIRSLLRISRGGAAVEQFYKDFKLRNGIRPTALETFQEWYNIRSLDYSSWFEFVNHMGDLDQDQQEALRESGTFLKELEKTKMSKSYKMLTLLAMLNEDCFPGEIEITTLAESFKRIASRSARYISDLSVDIADNSKMIDLIIKNPINAWVEGRGTDGVKYFDFENNIFKTRFNIDDKSRNAFQGLSREIVEWRLAKYLQRSKAGEGQEGKILCRVSHSKSGPILFLPD